MADQPTLDSIDGKLKEYSAAAQEAQKGVTDGREAIDKENASFFSLAYWSSVFSGTYSDHKFYADVIQPYYSASRNLNTAITGFRTLVEKGSNDDGTRSRMSDMAQELFKGDKGLRDLRNQVTELHQAGSTSDRRLTTPDSVDPTLKNFDETIAIWNKTVESWIREKPTTESAATSEAQATTAEGLKEITDRNLKLFPDPANDPYRSMKRTEVEQAIVGQDKTGKRIDGLIGQEVPEVKRLLKEQKKNVSEAGLKESMGSAARGIYAGDKASIVAPFGDERAKKIKQILEDNKKVFRDKDGNITVDINVKRALDQVNRMPGHADLNRGAFNYFLGAATRPGTPKKIETVAGHQIVVYLPAPQPNAVDAVKGATFDLGTTGLAVPANVGSKPVALGLDPGQVDPEKASPGKAWETFKVLTDKMGTNNAPGATVRP